MREVDWFERASRYERLTSQYRDMADSVERGDMQRISWLPKAIPRGRTPEWYRAKAEAYDQKAEACHQRDVEQEQVEEMTRLMAMPEEERDAQEFLHAGVIAGMAADGLLRLSLKVHAAAVATLIEGLRQRCAEEGVEWPLGDV